MSNELVQPVVKGKLRRLQAALKARLAGEGTAWILLAVVAAVLATLALDWLLRLPMEVRIGLAVIVLAGIGYVVFRYLLRPLTVEMDSDNLALLVEKRHGKLGDRLISALQFDRQEASSRLNVSEAMIERLACEANDLAGQMDFNEVVERRGMMRMLGAACCAIVLLTGFSIWQHELMSIWFQRNVMFRAIAYPQSTYLEVQGNDFFPLRGDDLRVLVYARHGYQAPGEVIFHPKFKDTGEAMIKAPKVDDPSFVFPVVCPQCRQTTWFKVEQCGQVVSCEKHDKDGHFCEGIIQLPAGVYYNSFPVQDSFEFYVTGGDDRLDKDNPHKVLAIDPPGVSTAQFTVEYDGYQNEPNRVFDGSSGVILAKVGSSIIVMAEANKDIALDGATLQIDDGKKVPMQVSMMKVDGKDVPRMLQGRIALGTDNQEAIKQLKISLTDIDGHRNRLATPYLIQYKPDDKPDVKVKTRNIGARVTARVALPLILTVKDDCGLDHIECIRGAANTKEGATTRPAFDPILVANKLSGREYSGPWTLDTEGMKLQPGDNLTVAVKAYDNMPGELKGPNANTSGTMTFSVVTDQELLDEMSGRLLSISSEFDPTQAQWAKGTGDIEGAKSVMKDEVTPQVRQSIKDAAKSVAAVSSICNKTLVSVDALHDEKLSNKLINGEDHLGDAMKRLTDLQETLPKLQAQINQASTGTDVQTLASNLDSILEEQNRIKSVLAEVTSDFNKDINQNRIDGQWEKVMNIADQIRIELENKANQDSGINIEESGVNKAEPKTQPAGSEARP